MVINMRRSLVHKKLKSYGIIFHKSTPAKEYIEDADIRVLLYDPINTSINNTLNKKMSEVVDTIINEENNLNLKGCYIDEYL